MRSCQPPHLYCPSVHSWSQSLAEVVVSGGRTAESPSAPRSPAVAPSSAPHHTSRHLALTPTNNDDDHVCTRRYFSHHSQASNSCCYNFSTTFDAQQPAHRCNVRSLSLNYRRPTCLTTTITFNQSLIYYHLTHTHISNMLSFVHSPDGGTSQM